MPQVHALFEIKSTELLSIHIVVIKFLTNKLLESSGHSVCSFVVQVVAQSPNLQGSE